MQRAAVCPPEVVARIEALRVPADDVAGTRMTTNWRNGGGGGGGGDRGRGGRWTGGGGGGGDRGRWTGGGGDRGRWTGGGGGGGGTPPPRRTYMERAQAPRFGNKGRADVTTEERMMDRIRDKMNKFSTMTYDATKGWLSELLDSGQTGFLTDFITLVFEKAAAEECFCAIYARLITELCGSFPHLASELRRIFGEFMEIFKEAAEEPDVAAAEYSAFVALRARRSYRRGYAAFVGEIANLRVLTAEDVLGTCNIILDGFVAAKTQEGKGLLCEEYADCLTSLAKRCKGLLTPLTPRVKDAMDRTGSPSLTNKARFALMDVADLL